jgi:hypothetical protein
MRPGSRSWRQALHFVVESLEAVERLLECGGNRNSCYAPGMIRCDAAVHSCYCSNAQGTMPCSLHILLKSPQQMAGIWQAAATPSGERRLKVVSEDDSGNAAIRGRRDIHTRTGASAEVASAMRGVRYVADVIWRSRNVPIKRCQSSWTASRGSRSNARGRNTLHEEVRDNGPSDELAVSVGCASHRPAQGRPTSLGMRNLIEAASWMPRTKTPMTMASTDQQH